MVFNRIENINLKKGTLPDLLITKTSGWKSEDW